MSLPRKMRVYRPDEVVVFQKTREAFGGLSNMAAGFPLVVNGAAIRTSEALYQSCRFPLRPDIQQEIIDKHSPMAAKMRGRKFIEETRSDWNRIQIKVMRWCLRVKLAQNEETFGDLLLSTEGKPIVEKKAKKDLFWGTNLQEDGTLKGANFLGRLLMELREELQNDSTGALRVVEPLPISDFLLLGEPIGLVKAPVSEAGVKEEWHERANDNESSPAAHQHPLFG